MIVPGNSTDSQQIYTGLLNSVPFFENTQYIKKEDYSNFGTFEIASLPNVLRHYLRKYGIHSAAQRLGSVNTKPLGMVEVCKMIELHWKQSLWEPT